MWLVKFCRDLVGHLSDRLVWLEQTLKYLAALAVAAIVALVGLVWLLQGLGAIPGSFMTGDGFWALAGLALIGAAAAYGAWPHLRRG